MKPKFYLAASVVLMLVFVLVSGTAAAQPPNPCDHDYVVRTGNIIRVSPTGVDDTDNIQCAFDWAIAEGPGMTIRMLPGTFHTAQILVVGFNGSFRGSGTRDSEIVNLPDLYVIPDIEHTPPSPGHPWPNLFIFLDSDVTFTNLAIRIVGENPVSAWYIGEFGPFTQFGTAIIVSGTESDFRVSNISLEGEHSSTSPIGYNVFNGIVFSGYVTTTGVDFAPLSGALLVQGSTFETIGWPTAFGNTSDASGLISHNTYSDVVVAIDAEDLVNTSLKVFGNRIETNDAGILAYNVLLPGDVDTDYEIRNNIIKGPTGIGMFQVLDETSTCLIKGNNLRWVTGESIILGDGAQKSVLKKINE